MSRAPTIRCAAYGGWPPKRGGWGPQSTGEKLASALVLNRPDWIASMDYTLAEAIDRVGAQWLALIPTAARTLRDEAEAEGDAG